MSTQYAVLLVKYTGDHIERTIYCKTLGELNERLIALKSENSSACNIQVYLNEESYVKTSTWSSPTSPSLPTNDAMTLHAS